MKTRKELIEELRETRPNVAISVHYEYDNDSYQQWEDEQTVEEMESEGLTAYVVEVRAETIKCGVLHRGSSYLGSCWMRCEDECEEIHGYFPQMLEYALNKADELIN